MKSERESPVNGLNVKRLSPRYAKDNNTLDLSGIHQSNDNAARVQDVSGELCCLVSIITTA